MTDEERFFEAVAAIAPAPLPALRVGDWDALPLTVRLAETLAEALVLTSELRADLANDEAASLAWIAPSVDEVFERLGATLQQLSS